MSVREIGASQLADRPHRGHRQDQYRDDAGEPGPRIGAAVLRPQQHPGHQHERADWASEKLSTRINSLSSTKVKTISAAKVIPVISAVPRQDTG